MFPDFRESDLNYIGESVQNPERSAALVQLVNQLAQTAGNVPLWVEVDAADAAEGTAEMFQPDTLHVSGVVLDLAENAAQAKTLLPQRKRHRRTEPVCSCRQHKRRRCISKKDLKRTTAAVQACIYIEKGISCFERETWENDR